MTLFIGVITTSMEEAQEENDKERKDETQVKKIVLDAGVSCCCLLFVVCCLLFVVCVVVCLLFVFF